MDNFTHALITYLGPLPTTLFLRLCKVVLSCFCLVFFFSLAGCVFLVAYQIHDCHQHVSPVVSVIVMILIFIGFGGYQSNFIKINRVLEPSKDLAPFVHWSMQGYNIGSTIITTGCQPYVCLDTNNLSGRIVFSS